MVFNVPWHNGVNLCAIVKENHAALSTNSYPGYILDPIPLVKGVMIQEGSPCLAFYALDILSWGTFNVAVFPSGAQPPLLGTVPSFQFKSASAFFLPAVGNHRWSGLGCHSDNNASPPVECLSLLWQGIQWTLWSHLWCYLGPHCWCLPPHWHSFLLGVPSVQRELRPADCPWVSTEGRSTFGLLVLATAKLWEVFIASSFSASSATQR